MNLIESAAARQRNHDRTTTPTERKVRGHFGTPIQTAAFMAGMFDIPTQPDLRLLDAGAGVGILSAAVCEVVAQLPLPQTVYVEAWENDLKLGPHLRATLSDCQKELVRQGHRMTFDIVADDFILGRASGGLFDTAAPEPFHLAILNPPYFKLRKDSPHALTMAHVVHGQPNIYAFFMAHAADLLHDGGELVAITPRSYFNGPYFKKFRKWFFDRMTVRHIHTFDARDDVFRNDAVLQENVILKAKKNAPEADVLMTSSSGRDCRNPTSTTALYSGVMDNTTDDHIIRVATDRDEHAILEAVENLPCRFRNLPYRISTGPVVTFRSTQFLRDSRDADTAPLLWMHNVRPFVTQFPPKNGKPTHILVSDASMKLLLPTKRYVLMKRFTAKEENRRLVAGIFTPSDSYSDFVGLENHLNYVHVPNGELTDADAYGLAGFLNSTIIDRYFRAVSGNTQVNATEIRNLPVPEQKTIRAIGERLLAGRRDDLDLIVAEAIRLPPDQTPSGAST